jgi:mannose-6-phosphate isomerase-like protein (cupin superfamily)
MECFSRSEITLTHLPGRVIQKAVGPDSFSTSNKMVVGFAYYSSESGPMEPHHHAEETVYVINASDGWVEYGEEKAALNHRIQLKGGIVLHIPENEWHAFRYGEEGFVDILFIYGQSDNIRPEESPGSSMPAR